MIDTVAAFVVVVAGCNRSFVAVAKDTSRPAATSSYLSTSIPKHPLIIIQPNIVTCDRNDYNVESIELGG